MLLGENLRQAALTSHSVSNFLGRERRWSGAVSSGHALCHAQPSFRFNFLKAIVVVLPSQLDKFVRPFSKLRDKSNLTFNVLKFRLTVP